MSTTYESFIKANLNLFECMQKFPKAQYDEMSDSAKEVVCRSEAEAVACHLKGDTVNFRSILNERLAHLKAAKQ